MSRDVAVNCLGRAERTSMLNGPLRPRKGTLTTEPAQAAPRRRVLLVDDDARVRNALRALLSSTQGLAVAGEASSAPDALQADEQLGPDVVLLDLLLPTAGDGLEVLRRLVGRGRTVVALSIRVQLRRAALDAGAAAFVEKGVSPDVLLEVLRSGR
jgi:DNA-binding NarL/FixJ family response regulator